MYTRSARFYDRLYTGGGTHALRDGRAEAERIMCEARAATPTARSLLDVACGTGRYLRHLPVGLQVEGIDLNPDLLDVARAALPTATFHEGDMTAFDLGRRFDVITCLFSSVAYVVTLEKLRRALSCIVAHLEPGGVVIIEPWFTPESYWEGHVAANYLDEPDLKVAWMYRQECDGGVSVLPIHYLVATTEGIEAFTERHYLGLFTHEEYLTAMAEAGLQVTFDPDGFGRGLYVGIDMRAAG
jgi:SAM-dependent methyltransferase